MDRLCLWYARGMRMTHKRGKKEEISPFYVVLKWLVDLSVAVGAALFIGVFLGEQITMTGYSMEPVLTNEDELLMDRLLYHFKEPERGDIIIFLPRSDASQYYIKRIIALPGETVQIKDGVLYINGEVQRMEDGLEKILNPGLAKEEIVLGEDEYFVLGDNRNNSEDSRFSSVGNVKRSNIIGKVWLKVTSLNDISLVK